MKKKNIIIITLCILSLSKVLNAQKIEWGNKNETLLNSKTFIPEILGEDNESFYVYTSKENLGNYTLERINKDNKTNAYINLYNENQKGVVIRNRRALFIDNRIIIIFSAFTSSNLKNEIYAKVINSKTGKVIDEHIELFSKTSDSRKSAATGVTNVYLSPNNSKIVINFYNTEFGQKEFIETYILYNEKLEKITSRSDISEVNGRKTRGSNFTLDDSGNLYFLNQSNKNNYLVSFSAENDYEKWEEKIDLSQLDIDLKSTISSIQLNLNQLDEMYIYGVYKNQENEFKGYICLKTDKKSKEIIQSKLILIDDAKLDKYKSRYKDEFREIDLRIVNLINGAIILASELKQTATFTNSNAIRYMYEDVLLTKISTSFEIDWTIQIPLWQMYMADKPSKSKFILPFFSYTITSDLKELNILTNEKKTGGYLNNYKYSRIIVHSISIETGLLKSTSLIDYTENGLWFMPQVSYQKKQGSSAIVFSKKNKEYSIGVFKK